MGNKIVFASNINIGQNGAENDDEYLFKCFVDHEALLELRNLDNSKMFILGSTGTGKTAFLRMLDRQEKNCLNLEFHEMAMSRLANSDVIQFLQSLDIDLSLFFQTLWRQVIYIEYVKLLGIANDRHNFKYKVGKMLDSLLRPKSREKLEKFLNDNTDRFWNTIDENVIELTSGLESSVNAELGGEVEKFVARAGYSRSLSSEKRTQLQQRARKFVSSETLADIAQVGNALSDYVKGRSDRYFLLIDKLDEHWVDERIKYPLIHALFESVKPLRNLRNFKVVVALRTDVYERMLAESPTSQVQLEKYDDLIVRVRWSKDQLWSLAEKRINHLFKWKYSSENVHFSHIFSADIDGRTSNWNYIVDRTLYRPRDIINFINLALRAAEGKSSVSKSDFLRGEREYSELRLAALKHEWSSAYPAIGTLLDMLVAKPAYFGVAEYCTSDLVQYLFDKVGQTRELQRDPLWRMLDRALKAGGQPDPLDFARVVFSRLHLVGAVGLKTDGASPWQWIYQSGKPISLHSINLATKVEVHPMLRSALHTGQDSHGARARRGA